MMLNNASSSDKFKRTTALASQNVALTINGALPGEGIDKGATSNMFVIAKDLQHERQIQLKEKIAEGGEGSVFNTSLDEYVAKIYRRDKLTSDRKSKLELMISKKISCDGVCFPEALILNDCGEFVGYLMRKAQGHELGKSIFQPKLLSRKFPNWTKRDTIQLCITILEKIKYLNNRNIILGDINPANILVVSPTKVFFVDCDSYQIEGHPCPVGTANFTPPEAQGKDYKTFLRTQEMENFAIATLLFMIMLPGKPPYSAVGGASPERNIINGEFPYPLTEDTDKTPPGKWGFIWSHLSYKTKEAFFKTFKRGEKYFRPANRMNADQWISVFQAYSSALPKMMNNDPMANDIFPTRKKGENVVEYRVCAKCGCKFPITKNLKDWEQRKTEQEGSPVRISVCDTCKASPMSKQGGYRVKPNYNQKNGAASSYRPTTQTNRSIQQQKTTGYRQASYSPATNSKSKLQQAGTNKNANQASSKADRVFFKFIIFLSICLLIFIMLGVGTCARSHGSSAASSSSKTSSRVSTYAASYESDRSKYDAMTDKQLEKEGLLRFGSFPESENGAVKPIYWHKVSQNGNYTEYISEFVISWMPYSSNSSTPWEDADICRWLNTDFLQSSFTEIERQKLIRDEHHNFISLLPPEIATKGQISLAKFPTPYAKSMGADTTLWSSKSQSGNVIRGIADWWLFEAALPELAPTAYNTVSDNEKIGVEQSCGVVPVIKVSKK